MEIHLDLFDLLDRPLVHGTDEVPSTRSRTTEESRTDKSEILEWDDRGGMTHRTEGGGSRLPRTTVLDTSWYTSRVCSGLETLPYQSLLKDLLKSFD